jgi:hypothetical protein
MAVTQADLEAFQRLAAERLAGEGAESLSDLLHEWESARERRETIDSVKRGLADIDAGRTRGATDLLDELRAGPNSK